MRRNRLIYLLPIAIFLAAAAAFAIALTGERRPNEIPSVLLDHPAPLLTLPALEGSGVPGLTPETLKGQVTLVNLWASWCLACKIEHPLLMEMAARGDLRIVGIAWKDEPEEALLFLRGRGNPFAAIGVDERGRAGIDWGISGVPESFLVDQDGVVRFRRAGPFNDVDIQEVLIPLIEQLNEGGG